MSFLRFSCLLSSPQVPRPWDFPPSPNVAAKEEAPVESPSQHPAVINPLPEKTNAHSLLDAVTTDSA
jgi:hypothetical protein